VLGSLDSQRPVDHSLGWWQPVLDWLVKPLVGHSLALSQLGRELGWLAKPLVVHNLALSQPGRELGWLEKPLVVRILVLSQLALELGSLGSQRPVGRNPEL
jgi:hypothetical protein